MRIQKMITGKPSTTTTKTHQTQSIQEKKNINKKFKQQQMRIRRRSVSGFIYFFQRNIKNIVYFKKKEKYIFLML